MLLDDSLMSKFFSLVSYIKIPNNDEMEENKRIVFLGVVNVL